MKINKLIPFLFLCVTSFALTSCGDEEDIIFDYSPITLKVNVHNSNGENLLEKSTPGNILDDKNTFSFNGETSDIYVGWPNEEKDVSSETRFYMPMWYGAFIAPSFYKYSYYDKGENAIYIGEFDGAASGTLNMELNLGEHKYEISVKSKVNGKDVKREYTINGKKNKSDVFNIIL